MQEKLRRLCLTAGDEVRPLEATVDALCASGYKPEAAGILRESLALPGAHPHVGALWIRRVVSRRTWNRRYPDGLDKLCERGEIGRRAVLEFLQSAAVARKPELVKTAIKRHRRWLREDPAAWATAGRALVAARCYRAAARWMSDWRRKTELDLPTLDALAAALRAEGRLRAASEVISSALEKPGAGQLPSLQIAFAMEEALLGRTASAAEALKRTQPSHADPDSVCRYYLARGVIRVQQAEPGSRREAFRAAAERADDQFKRSPVHRRDMLLRREYRRCLWRMARDSGRWWRALLAAWRSADSPLVLLALLLVPGLQLFAPLYLYRLCSHRYG